MFRCNINLFLASILREGLACIRQSQVQVRFMMPHHQGLLCCRAPAICRQCQKPFLCELIEQCFDEVRLPPNTATTLGPDFVASERGR